MSRQMPDNTPTILVRNAPRSLSPAGRPGGRTPLIVGGVAGCLVIVLLLACGGGAAWYFLAGPGKASAMPTVAVVASAAPPAATAPGTSSGPIATATPLPTDTEPPTGTPAPTRTPKPPSTATPLPTASPSATQTSTRRPMTGPSFLDTVVAVKKQVENFGGQIDIAAGSGKLDCQETVNSYEYVAARATISYVPASLMGAYGLYTQGVNIFITKSADLYQNCKNLLANPNGGAIPALQWTVARTSVNDASQLLRQAIIAAGGTP